MTATLSAVRQPNEVATIPARQHVSPDSVDFADPSLPDELLVVAACAGDRAAMTQLHNRYAPMVHAILLAKLPRPHVEDLVQDVFVHAIGRLGTLREPSAFGPWLATIARNRATDHYRRAKPTVELNEEVPAEVADPRIQLQARRVLAVIRQLPETYREPLLMRLLEGMTGPEIAVRTGLTAASVRVNLHRGMRRLRQALQEKRP